MRPPFRRTIATLGAAAFCGLASFCGAHAEDAEPLKIPDTQLEPLAWGALDGWTADDQVAAFSAFTMRCAYSAASSGMTRNTDPPTAVTVSDLRMSRREIVMFRLPGFPSSLRPTSNRRPARLAP